MKSDEMWTIVVQQDDAVDEVYVAAVREWVEANPPMVGTLTRWKIKLVHWLHPVGIHLWAHYRTFDPGSGRAIEWPGRWVCCHPQCYQGRISG